MPHAPICRDAFAKFSTNKMRLLTVMHNGLFHFDQYITSQRHVRSLCKAEAAHIVYCIYPKDNGDTA